MQQSRLEVADILKEYAREFIQLYRVTATSILQVMNAILRCRTAALGGHVSACKDCGTVDQSYNSCRNRHCPKCLGSKTAKWMEDRRSELLPVPYFHAVFTLPHEFNPLALRNKKILYDILFKAAWETLKEVAANPKHLGAQIGAFGILHTWNQKLELHPHIHFVCTGGGLSSDKKRWIASKSAKFFAPVGVLQKVYRGKFIDYLKQAYYSDKLSLEGSTADLQNPEIFEQLLNRACSKLWNVYCKPPLQGETATLKYLSSYTHRIAISNHRLVSLENGKVTFSYRDSADGCKRKNLSIAAVEFIRRFMLHILPKNFYRIRHFGFLSNAHRSRNLDCARELLHLKKPETITAEPEGLSCATCSHCKSNNLVVLSKIDPIRDSTFNFWDSS